MPSFTNTFTLSFLSSDNALFILSSDAGSKNLVIGLIGLFSEAIALYSSFVILPSFNLAAASWTIGFLAEIVGSPLPSLESSQSIFFSFENWGVLEFAAQVNL